MTPRFSAPLRLAAVGAATAVVGVVATTPALAAGNGNVAVTNTETVQVYTSSTGEIQNQRVYEQLAMVGNGKVDLSNPISTDGLRNLDGFGGFTVKDGNQIVDTTVDGQKRVRSVSNFHGKLPLDVSVAYKLDGKNVAPGDVVGKSGHLEVRYTVKNVTAKPEQVSFDNGHGGTITRTALVPIPIVGTLSVTAPPTFTHVTSEAANMGGDGKGGTQMSFTMTLFPPIATDTAVFGYDADITDGVVPRAEISALPVDPLASPTFKGGAASYKSGAASGVQLTEGATTIDTNLLKLRDGAAKLLSGLIQLRDGAQQLETGLAGQAAPGADKLAAGAGQLDAGLGKLDAGGKQLAAGTGQAASGSGKLAVGADQLSGGLGQLNGGVGDLADGQHALEKGLTTLHDGVAELPQSVRDQLAGNADYNQALLALTLVIGGIGSPTDVTDPATGLPNTLLGGLNAIELGLTKQVQPGLAQILAGIPDSKSKLQCASAIVGAVAGGPAAPAACTGGAPLVASSDATTRAVLQSVASGLSTSSGDLDTLAGALTQISNAIDQQFVPGLDKIKLGLSNPDSNPETCAKTLFDPPHKCGIKEVAIALKAGIPVLVDTLTNNISSQLLAGIGAPTPGCDPKKTLRCGAAALSSGVDQVVSGVGKLNAGGIQLADGAGQLNTGLGKIDSGAGQLSGGLGQAKDGSGQLSAGAQQLATGLGAAANGSGKLADGLGQAAAGAPKLVDGAQQLSTKGTKKLVAAGEATARSYGQQYAVFKAGAVRANTQSMAFGAPAGATGLTAYSYVIQGEDGETSRNWTRGLTGLALLGAGGVAFGLRRRFV